MPGPVGGVLFTPLGACHRGAGNEWIQGEPESSVRVFNDGAEEIDALVLDVEDVWRQVVVVVVAVEDVAQLDLLQVVGAADGTRLLTRLRQGRQQHGCKNRDDCNHNKQLDKGECFPHWRISPGVVCFCQSRE